MDCPLWDQNVNATEGSIMMNYCLQLADRLSQSEDCDWYTVHHVVEKAMFS